MKKAIRQPPRWAEQLLQWACRPDYADEVLGDLREAYLWRAETKSPGNAARNFILEVLLSLRFTHLKPFYHFNINTMMLGNYLKIAFRNMYKRKAYSRHQYSRAIGGSGGFPHDFYVRMAGAYLRRLPRQQKPHFYAV